MLERATGTSPRLAHTNPGVRFTPKSIPRCMCSVPTCNGISCSSTLDTSCPLLLSREHSTNYLQEVCAFGCICFYIEVIPDHYTSFKNQI